MGHSTACGAITMSGGSGTDSWNSATSGGVASPPISYVNGNLGTLGNVYLHNSAMVAGNIAAPNYNLGDPNAKTNGTSNYYPYGVSGGPTWPYWNPQCNSGELQFDVAVRSEHGQLGRQRIRMHQQQRVHLRG